MSEPVSKDDFNRFVDRHDRQHGDLDGRLARDMVPLAAFLAEQRSTERRFTELEHDLAAKVDLNRMVAAEGRLSTIEGRPVATRTLVLALAGLALTVLGIVVSAYVNTHK